MHTNRTSKLTMLAVGLILLWMVGVVTCAQLRLSPTFDEQNHVTRGIAILRTGDYRLCFHHPPLANILEGLPVAWLRNGFSTTMSGWREGANPAAIWTAARQTIWADPPHGVRLIQLARLPVLLFTIVLALLVFCWARELFGNRGGLFALALFALDPNIIAHSGLATTDLAAACTIVLGMYLLRRYLLKPSRSALLLAGLGIGLAMATKFSALIFCPLLALLLLFFTFTPSPSGSLSEQWRAFPWGKRLLRAVGVGALILLVAGVVVWGVYGFHVEGFGSKPGRPVAASASWQEKFPIPAFQYFRGIKAVMSEAEGHPAYLLGQTDNTGKGWWYYFPVAIASKTPIPALLLMIGMLICLGLPRFRARLGIPSYELAFLLLPVALFLLAALGIFGFSLNLGLRHLLPIYPFLCILAGGWAALRLPSRLYLPALGFVLLTQLASIAMAFPDYLAYFNEAAETCGEGYHILVDSNYDWGQDLNALATLQRKDKLYPLTFSYFGSTPPEAYGLPCTPAAGYGFMSDAPAPDWSRFNGFFAISVTNLMGRYTDADYSFLQRNQPYAQAGKTILIYWLPRFQPTASAQEDTSHVSLQK